MCGIAGALYVPQVASSTQRDVAGGQHRDRHLGGGGGRGTLIGPIVGAFFVNGAKSWFTQASRDLAVLPGRAVHRGDAVPAARIVGLVRKLRGHKDERA